MKKEVLFAIIIGFIIGLVITFGIYTAQSAIQSKTSQSSNKKQDSTTATTDSSHKLTIISPTNEALFTQDSVPITGTTSPGSIVVIVSTSQELFARADGQGNFSVDVELSGGVNNFDIVSYQDDGNKIDQSLTLTYTTAELDKKTDQTNEDTTDQAEENTDE